MLKKLLLSIALLVGSSSLLLAKPCIDYLLANSNESFLCININQDPESARYTITNGNYSSNGGENNIGYCSSATDTTCLLANRPAHINSGDWVYVKNTTEASDYFKAQFVYGTGFQNAQAHNPAPAPTAVPLSPFSKLLLALLFMGASLMMLRRKGAKV